MPAAATAARASSLPRPPSRRSIPFVGINLIRINGVPRPELTFLTSLPHTASGIILFGTCAMATAGALQAAYDRDASDSARAPGACDRRHRRGFGRRSSDCAGQRACSAVRGTCRLLAAARCCRLRAGRSWVACAWLASARAVVQVEAAVLWPVGRRCGASSQVPVACDPTAHARAAHSARPRARDRRMQCRGGCHRLHSQRRTQFQSATGATGAGNDRRGGELEPK